MSKIFWARTAHCMICKHGYRGTGAQKLALACFDFGEPAFAFDVNDCVQFKGKEHLWVITARYYVNAIDLAPRSGVKPGHVKCYSLQSCQYPQNTLECVKEGVLEQWSCE